jgi:hypothetical protein
MAFWLVLVVFCGWFILMFLQLRRAIREEEREALTGEPAPAASPSLVG